MDRVAAIGAASLSHRGTAARATDRRGCGSRSVPRSQVHHDRGCCRPETHLALFQKYRWGTSRRTGPPWSAGSGCPSTSQAIHALPSLTSARGRLVVYPVCERASTCVAAGSGRATARRSSTDTPVKRHAELRPRRHAVDVAVVLRWGQGVDLLPVPRHRLLDESVDGERPVAARQARPGLGGQDRPTGPGVVLTRRQPWIKLGCPAAAESTGEQGHPRTLRVARCTANGDATGPKRALCGHSSSADGASPVRPDWAAWIAVQPLPAAPLFATALVASGAITLSRGTADQRLARRAARRPRASSQVVIVAGETGSGKSTQLPKLCLEAGRGVAGLIGHTQPRRDRRPHDRRAPRQRARHVGRRGGRLHRALQRPRRRRDARARDDRRHPPRRDPARPHAAPLRHAHRRRGARAQPQHRLHPRLPAPAAAATPRPHRRRHVGDDRHGSLRRPLRHRRCRRAGHRGHRPHVSRSRSATDRSARLRRRPRPGAGGRRRRRRARTGRSRRRARVPVRRARDPRHRRRVAPASSATTPRCCRCTPGSRRPSSTASSSRTAAGASCSARTSPRRRSRCPACATSSTPARRGSPATAAVSRCSGCRSSRCRRRRRTNAPGRCGRVGPGICIRLYSEDDFAARPEFTEPEILRTNLASVILQMTAIGLGDVAAFPFVEPPDSAAVRDGYLLLEELAAIGPADPGGARPLTPIGRRLARLPVDPRLGRMVLEADRHGCVREVLVIAAALSIQDPRERPLAERAAGRRGPPPLRRRRARTCCRSSRCGTTSAPSSGSGRPTSSASCAVPSTSTTSGCGSGRTCSASSARSPATSGIRVCRPDGTSGTVHPDHVHQSVLAGLLSHLGFRDRDPREFRGARGATFVIAPGSVLAKKPPRWVMAAELVETNRVWARRVAIGPTGVGRAHRRPPRQALVQRAAVGSSQRSRHRHRDGDAVRPADRQRPHRRLRPCRPGGGA